MKTIFTGFAPNMTADDLKTACGFLFFPWRWRSWKRGDAPKKVEAWLQDFFDVSTAMTLDSGRSALSLSLRALGVGKGDDVLVQAYTCVVVVNAIRWIGANPIYVDMKENFFMDPEDAERKITQNAKAIVIQHTFGIPAPLDELLAIAARHRLKTVEDCAHTIGGRYQGKLLGTFGDIGMFSFGSDKMISCVRGGAVITDDPIIGKRLKEFCDALPYPSCHRMAQYLVHYPIFFIGKKWYHLLLGKALLWLSRHLHITPDIVTAKEKRGVNTGEYPTKLPHALAAIALQQLNGLEDTLVHRKKIARLYGKNIHNSRVTLQHDPREEEDVAYVRYPILTDHPKQLLRHAKRRGIILGDWYDSVVAPCVNGCPHAKYEEESCPRAENASRGSVNLPTDISISESDAGRIIHCINAYME